MLCFACAKAPTFLLTDVHIAATWSEKDRCSSTNIPKTRAEAEGAIGGGGGGGVTTENC